MLGAFRNAGRQHLAIVAAALLGCGGGKGDGPTGPAPVATLDIVGAPTAPILIGTTAQLTPVPRDASGAVLANRTVAWTSSNETIARVDGSGLVTGVGAGQATITGTVEGKTNSVAFDFRLGGTMSPDGGAISVLGGALTVTIPRDAVSQASILTVLPSPAAPADARLAHATAYALGPAGFAWARPATLTLRYDRTRLPSGLSEASLLLGVLSGGTWTSVPGSTVDAASGTVSGPITRTGTYVVLSAPVDHIVLGGVPAAGQLYVGQSVQLTATPVDAANNPLAGRPVVWSSSDPSKVSVASGRITAVDVGTSTITATVEGKTASATIVTALVPVATVTLAPQSSAVYMGATIQLTATLKDGLGAVLAGRTVTWSSSDPLRATVDASGKVATLATGTVTITAASEGKSATSSLTILPAVVADWTRATEWWTYQGNASHTGYVPVTADPARFGEAWTTTVLAGAALNPVAAGDGKVFVSSQAYFGRQIIVTLDAATGAAKWSYDFGAIHSVDPPAYGNGKIYVQTGGHGDSFLWAFDANNGAIAFRSAYANQWSRWYAPVVVDQTVYAAGGYYGGMYAFSAVDGAKTWSATLAQNDQFVPAVKDGLVYVYQGAGSGKLTVVSAATGTMQFEIAEPGPANVYSLDGAPALGGASDALIIQGNRLLSFDLAGRRVAWTKTGTFTGNVTVGNGHLYVINNKQLEVRAEADGALEWVWVPPEGSVTGTIVATNNLAFVGTAAKTYAIDLASHLMVWSYPAGGLLALNQQGQLLISQATGKVTAITLK